MITSSQNAQGSLMGALPWILFILVGVPSRVAIRSAGPGAEGDSIPRMRKSPRFS